MVLGFNIEQLYTRLVSSQRTNQLDITTFEAFYTQHKDLPHTDNTMWQDLTQFCENLGANKLKNVNGLSDECILRLSLSHNGNLRLESLP